MSSPCLDQKVLRQPSPEVSPKLSPRSSPRKFVPGPAPTQNPTSSLSQQAPQDVLRVLFDANASSMSSFRVLYNLEVTGTKILKLGNLYPSRDFTYVKDTARGFLEIAKTHSLYGEITNIGSQKEISIKDLVTLITKLPYPNLARASWWYRWKGSPA